MLICQSDSEKKIARVVLRQNRRVLRVSSYLPELLVRLLQIRGLPQVFVGVQVDVGVVLPLRRIAVALLALLQPLGVRLLVVLLALPVRLVRVQVGVFEVVAVVEPAGRGNCNLDSHLQKSNFEMTHFLHSGRHLQENKLLMYQVMLNSESGGRWGKNTLLREKHLLTENVNA